MGKVIIIGESHLDLIAEMLCLHLVSKDSAEKISALALEVPETLITLDNIIAHIEQSIKEYSTLLTQIEIDRQTLQQINFTPVEFLVQQIKQQQIKLEMLKQVRTQADIKYYSIDKEIKKPIAESKNEDNLESDPVDPLMALMTDPERDEIMATNLVKIARENKGTTMAIIGYAHLIKLMPLLKNKLTEEEFKEFFFIHCFSGISYQETVVSEVLLSAPFRETSWKDPNGIYHLDCRDKPLESVAEQISAITDNKGLAEFLDSKALSSPQGKLSFSSSHYLSDLVKTLGKKPTHSFTPDFYNNYLIEDYYEAISADHSNSLEERLENFIDSIEIAHGPADPKLNNLFLMLALKQLIDLKTAKQLDVKDETKLYQQSLKQLEKLLDKNPQFRTGESFDKVSKISQEMVTIILDCKRGAKDKDSGLEEINRLIKDYENLVTEEGAKLVEVDPDEAETLEEQLTKLKQFKQMLPLVMQNLSLIDTYQLEMVKNALSPPTNNFAENQSKDDYYDGITYFCKAMLAVHELSPSPKEKDTFIVENFKKAGELGFAFAYVELGHYFKKKGDFTKAFESYLDAATKDSNVGYANLIMLLVEHKHKCPLAHFMLSAMHVHFINSRKVHNNYSLEFSQQRKLYEYMEALAQSEEKQVKSSLFGTSFITKETESFSLFSALMKKTISATPLNINHAEQLKGFEAGLDLLLSTKFGELYNNPNYESLAVNYALLAKLWFDVLDKFQRPQEQLIGLSTSLQNFLSNSSLPMTNPVQQTMEMVVKDIDRIILSERATLLMKDIEDIRLGKNLVNLDLPSQTNLGVLT